MSQFVVLSNDKHKQLRIKKNASMAYAATQQVLPIEVAEVTKAAINFPIFFTKNQHDEMTLSVISGLSAGTSLFMVKDGWDASYVPMCLKTYPFYLIQSPEDEKRFVIGIQEDNPSFSVTEGEAIFDEEGKASQNMMRVGDILNGHLDRIRATGLMVEKLDKLGLFKPLEILLQYQDNTARKMNGLYSIDEEKLNKLSTEQLASLHQDGTLFAIHALLISVYQINNLVRKYNQSEAANKIVNVKIELPEANN
jgi:hypothetical protein